VRAARLASEHDLEVRHTLFPLHPETPAQGLTLEALFGGRMDVNEAQAQMRTRMEAEGLPYGVRTHTYNSRRAQELSKWAEAQGHPLHDALYRAYFVDGINLADPQALVVIAEQAGLAGTEARRALEGGAWAAAVDRDWQRAREFGVTGVPTFVVGQRGVVGAQPYEVLEQLVVEGRRNTV